MSESSPRLGLPFIQPSQAQKHVTHNTALESLDCYVQATATEVGSTTPPGVPDEGQTHVIGTGATGLWAGHDGQIAHWTNGAWIFADPVEGFRIWDLTTDSLKVFSNDAWVDVVDFDALETLGINTSADLTNRLAIASDASLFTHDGNGHQLKVNKSTANDTASLLFQTGWSGRAEMGLNGSDDWSIKVSDDGSAWTDALTVDGGSGLLGGAAIQTGPEDGTDGRLWKSHGTQGVFGLGAIHSLDTTDADLIARTGLYRTMNGTLNIPVSDWGHTILHNQFDDQNGSQTLIARDSNAMFARRKNGGTWNDWVPVIPEQGSNANGYYTRFGDGTQICGFRLSVMPTPNAVTSTAFTFPAEFTYNGGSSTDDILLSALPVTSVPQVTVGQTGFTLSGGLGGALNTYRSNSTTTHYSCMAYGRWY